MYIPDSLEYPPILPQKIVCLYVFFTLLKRFSHYIIIFVFILLLDFGIFKGWKERFPLYNLVNNK